MVFEPSKYTSFFLMSRMPDRKSVFPLAGGPVNNRLYHANVDRIWSEWQNQHPNEYPNGLGCKLDPKAACDRVTIPGHDGYAWALDPFSKNEPDCRSIQQLGYSYV